MLKDIGGREELQHQVGCGLQQRRRVTETGLDSPHDQPAAMREEAGLIQMLRPRQRMALVWL